MRPIHNYPIVPDEAPRHRGSQNPPVLRSDLGADFRNALQFCGADWRTSPLYRQILVDARLGSVLGSFQWYNNIQELPARHEDLSKSGKAIDGWEAAAQRFADMGLFILAINSMAVTEIPQDIFDSLCRIFGKRFFGFNEGEWDGYYFRQASQGGFDLSPRRSREEACRHYLDWMGGCYARHQHRMVTCSSIASGCHYAAELGTRMLGLELPQSSLPSSMILLSFCRGAARQYDLLFFTIPSVFSMRGDIASQKAYPLAGQPQSFIAEHLGWVVGPEHGPTLGQMKRHWMLSYMSGASVLAFEGGEFPCDTRGEGMQLDYNLHTPAPLTTKTVTPSSVKASFTPLGWLFWECSQMAKLYPMRGVSYQPVALMLPFAHGWAPSCEYIRSKPNCVWGNILYNQGDWQIDRFMDRIYPGYKLANATPNPARDERGLVTNTPYGDLFDVILDNADESCLDKYRVIILLGTWEKGIAPEVAKRLKAFMEKGGVVVADRGQWPDAPGEGEAGKTVSARPSGKGRLILVGEPAWGADRTDSAAFAEIARALDPLLAECALIEIEGRPIYWSFNVTDQPDELIVTLCNNSHALPWEGRIRVKGAEIVEVEEWLAHGETDIQDGCLRCGVPPNDVRIFRIKTKEPFLNLRFRDIPWKKLGFGVPEWPEERT